MSPEEECSLILSHISRLENKLVCSPIPELNSFAGFEILVDFVDQEYFIKKLRDQEAKIELVSEIYQIFKVTQIQGIKKVIAHSDFHLGYSFPIGTVAAFDLKDKKLNIYPGSIGGDINCGMRVISTPYHKDDLENLMNHFTEENKPKKNKNEEEIKDLRALFADFLSSRIACGKKSSLGRKKASPNEIELEYDQVLEVLEKGVNSLDPSCSFGKKCEKMFPGIKIKKEGERVEHGGNWKLKKGISLYLNKTQIRTAERICSLGGGNHFLEVCSVEELYDKKMQDYFGLEEGQLCFIIHCGSRSFGQTVLHNSVAKIMGPEENSGEKKRLTREEKLKKVLVREGECFPYGSHDCDTYLESYKAACNYGWVNRALLSLKTAKAFQDFFEPIAKERMEKGFKLICDSTHNSFSFEKDTLLVRKGACRSISPDSKELEEGLRGIGLPVIVGGSMGTASYLLLNVNCEKSLNSVCHGAGRALSRSEANEQISAEQVKAELEELRIEVRCPKGSMTSEAPGAYKDIHKVIETEVNNGMVKRVVMVKPIIVVKD